MLGHFAVFVVFTDVFDNFFRDIFFKGVRVFPSTVLKSLINALLVEVFSRRFIDSAIKCLTHGAFFRWLIDCPD